MINSVRQTLPQSIYTMCTLQTYQGAFNVKHIPRYYSELILRQEQYNYQSVNHKRRKKCVL